MNLNILNIKFQVEEYWEQYAYLELRLPLSPYSLMVQPFPLSALGTEESPQNKLKTMARILYYTGEFWNLMRNERLKPTTSPDGSIHYSSNQYRRVYNTSRIPGEFIDEIKSYFKTAREGHCQSNVVIIGRGRIFYFDIMHGGELLSQQELLHVLTIARDKIENEICELGIPVLTCDERTNWYNFNAQFNHNSNLNLFHEGTKTENTSSNFLKTIKNSSR